MHVIAIAIATALGTTVVRKMEAAPERKPFHVPYLDHCICHLVSERATQTSKKYDHCICHLVPERAIITVVRAEDGKVCHSVSPDVELIVIDPPAGGTSTSTTSSNKDADMDDKIMTMK